MQTLQDVILGQPDSASVHAQKALQLLPRQAFFLQKEIAEKLHLVTENVKTHLQNIYRKLNTKGRIAAVKEARRLGIITHD